MKHLRVLKNLILSLLLLKTSFAFGQFKNPCTPQEREALFQNSQAPVYLTCSLILEPSQTLRKTLILSGSRASLTLIDCKGGSLEPSSGNNSLIIRSELVRQFQYDRPSGIQIQNCRIRGSVRISGLGPNGQAPKVRSSSRLNRNHTQRAQLAAPTDIIFTHNIFEIRNHTAIYVGPGSTRIQILNSIFQGFSKFVSIYLDAESAENVIEKNRFLTHQNDREIIAVDGSARNRISNNYFSGLSRGGIYLYRNCGEGGTIRVQAPQQNIIENNEFYYEDFIGYRTEIVWRERWGLRLPEQVRVYYPSIYLGSRQGNRSYCHLDRGFSYGSSVSDMDFADQNTVRGNRIRKLSPSLMIQNRGRNNHISGNQTIF